MSGDGGSCTVRSNINKFEHVNGVYYLVRGDGTGALYREGMGPIWRWALGPCTREGDKAKTLYRDPFTR